MGQIILFVILFIGVLLLGVKLGLSLIAEDLYNHEVIEKSERDYMKSWAFMKEILQDIYDT